MADIAAFDTLATARKLKAAGIAEAQAEAARAGRSELATKADIAALKADIAGLEVRFYRALMVLAGFTAAVAAVAVGLVQALG